MQLQGRKYKPNQTDRDYAQHEEGCDKEQRETANMYTERYQAEWTHLEVQLNKI